MTEIPNFPNQKEAAKYVADLESKTRFIAQAESVEEIRESALAACRLLDIAIGSDEDREDMKAYAQGIHYTLAIIVDIRSNSECSPEAYRMIFLHIFTKHSF